MDITNNLPPSEIPVAPAQPIAAPTPVAAAPTPPTSTPPTDQPVVVIKSKSSFSPPKINLSPKTRIVTAVLSVFILVGGLLTAVLNSQLRQLFGFKAAGNFKTGGNLSITWDSNGCATVPRDAFGRRQTCNGDYTSTTNSCTDNAEPIINAGGTVCIGNVACGTTVQADISKCNVSIVDGNCLSNTWNTAWASSYGGSCIGQQPGPTSAPTVGGCGTLCDNSTIDGDRSLCPSDGDWRCIKDENNSSPTRGKHICFSDSQCGGSLQPTPTTPPADTSTPVPTQPTATPTPTTPATGYSCPVGGKAGDVSIYEGSTTSTQTTIRWQDSTGEYATAGRFRVRVTTCQGLSNYPDGPVPVSVCPDSVNDKTFDSQSNTLNFSKNGGFSYFAISDLRPGTTYYTRLYSDIVNHPECGKSSIISFATTAISSSTTPTTPPVVGGQCIDPIVVLRSPGYPISLSEIRSGDVLQIRDKTDKVAAVNLKIYQGAGVGNEIYSQVGASSATPPGSNIFIATFDFTVPSNNHYRLSAIVQ